MLAERRLVLVTVSRENVFGLRRVFGNNRNWRGCASDVRLSTSYAKDLSSLMNKVIINRLSPFRTDLFFNSSLDSAMGGN